MNSHPTDGRRGVAPAARIPIFVHVEAIPILAAAGSGVCLSTGALSRRSIPRDDTRQKQCIV